jgi:predicted DNA-binding protein
MSAIATARTPAVPGGLNPPRQIRFRPDQEAKLEAIASQEDRPVAYVVRQAVDQYIERREAVA